MKSIILSNFNRTFCIKKESAFFKVSCGLIRNLVFFSPSLSTSQGSERVYGLNRNHWGTRSPARLCCGLSVFQTCWQEPQLVNPFVTCFPWPTTIGTSVVLPRLLLEFSISVKNLWQRQCISRIIRWDPIFWGDEFNAGIEKQSHTHWK